VRHPSLDDDRTRHPLLTDAGRAQLDFMREHPNAPLWNYACGDQLDAAGLEAVRAFGRRDAALWGEGELPAWLIDFTERVLRDVPFYRAYDASPVTSLPRFRALPLTSRDDLRREATRFVPDDQPLAPMMVYDTSGTTGTSLHVMADAVTSASILPLMRRALAAHGVTLTGGAGRVSIVLVGAQTATLTYATVSSVLDGAGFVKLNIESSQWRSPDDVTRYLDALCPEIYTGTPLSFEALAALDLKTRPKALLSTAMTLLPGTRARLEGHFGCPVLDVYSLTECRYVAVATSRGHRLLRPDLFVEIVDGNGAACPPGVRGEIVLSGGNNPFLPLLRYRTGDHGVLRCAPDGVYIDGLEGRPPVVFTASDGRPVNNIDITHALRDIALSRFALHQDEQEGLSFRYTGTVDEAAIALALRSALGADASITITRDEGLDGKWIQYSRSGGAGSPRTIGLEGDA